MSSNEIFSCNYSWLKTTKCDIANQKNSINRDDVHRIYRKFHITSEKSHQLSKFNILALKIRHRWKLFLTCEIIVRESWSSQALETLICELSERQRRSLLSNNNSIHFLEYNEKKFHFLSYSTFATLSAHISTLIVIKVPYTTHKKHQQQHAKRIYQLKTFYN